MNQTFLCSLYFLKEKKKTVLKYELKRPFLNYIFSKYEKSIIIYILQKQNKTKQYKNHWCWVDDSKMG